MTRREKTAVRRKQIIEATLALLADVPLSEVTTRRIARELGLSQPAIFRHFRSRDALLLAVVEHARGELGAVIERMVAAGPRVADQLAVLTSTLFGFTEQHPGFARLLFGDGVGGAVGEPVQVALRHMVSMQRTLVAELVRGGQRVGELRRGLDPVRAAGLFVGMIQGVILQWELEGRVRSLPAEAEALVGFWCRGAAARCDSEAADAEDPAERTPTSAVALESPPNATLRAVDARPILARGEDPLDAILAAVAAAGQGGLVALTVPFRPNPLLALLSSRGHEVQARKTDSGLWAVVVLCGGAPSLVDLRELAAPGPMEAVLQATATLAAGEAFIARLPRSPRLLLPHLDGRGLVHGQHEEPDGSVLLHVVRPR